MVDFKKEIEIGRKNRLFAYQTILEMFEENWTREEIIEALEELVFILSDKKEDLDVL